MAKDRKKIEEQIAALQAELDSDDDDTELWVEHPKTKAVGRLRGAHAKSFLDGILGTSDDDGAGKGKDDDDQGDDDDDDADDDAPPKKQSVWGRK
jgi:hypothetical protein